MTRVVRREDVLVSICVSDLRATSDSFRELKAFAASLGTRFRFFEILLVTENTEAFLPLVREIPNLRLLGLREGLSIYRHRVMAASEAIGDVVLVITRDQLGALDTIGMIEAAADSGRIVVGLRPEPGGISWLFSSVLSMAGRAAGFRAGLRDSPTIAFPRSLLNPLLEGSDPDLALRFIPRDPMYPVETWFSQSAAASVSEDSAIVRRLEMIGKIVIHMAPRVLLFVAVASGLLSLVGFLYALYVVSVWLIVPTIAPGWLTISLMMSLIATFMGSAIFGFSVGLQRILMLLNEQSLGATPHEINGTDLFGHVAEDLNVDLLQPDGTRDAR
jgi:hypothetical protein